MREVQVILCTAVVKRFDSAPAWEARPAIRRPGRLYCGVESSLESDRMQRTVCNCNADAGQKGLPPPQAPAGGPRPHVAARLAPRPPDDGIVVALPSVANGGRSARSVRWVDDL